MNIIQGKTMLIINIDPVVLHFAGWSLLVAILAAGSFLFIRNFKNYDSEQVKS